MTEPFIFSNGQIAHNAEDLIKLCQQFPDNSVGYLIREDFEKWLSYIGANKIAQYATEARQYSISDERKLDLFITKSQTKPEIETKPELEAEPEIEAKPTEAISEKPKVNFFTAIITFFAVLFNRKPKTND